MNKVIIIISWILCVSSCKNIYKNCNGVALLVPKQYYVPVYNKPNGIQVDSIINDTIKEDYPSLCIKRLLKNYAEIDVGYTFDTISIKGWIKLKYIGINPATTEPIFLRKKANKYSAVSDTISEPYWGDLYPILKCNGEWLYIKTKENGKWKKGWMAPEDQCDNPYSTCN